MTTADMKEFRHNFVPLFLIAAVMLSACAGASGSGDGASSDGTRWADVRPEWPDEPIQRFSPGTDSGTFDFLVEVVFDENEDPILNASNIQFSEDDNVLVTGVTGSPHAVGYFGYAYYEENQADLRALALEGVLPSAESVDAGDYPLARPLYIYSDARVMQEKPQVAAFLNFYLSYVNEEISEAGYFAASDAALAQARQNWLMAMGMDADSLPTADPLELTGPIVTAGSSTVFPLSEAMADRFRDEGYAGNITVDSIGSGAGFERFCVAGESDIANASRPIRESEIEACRAIGREPIEFRVGTDALAVAVGVDNVFVEGVTLDELALIFGSAE